MENNKEVATHNMHWWQDGGCGTLAVPVLGTKGIVYTQPI